MISFFRRCLTAALYLTMAVLILTGCAKEPIADPTTTTTTAPTTTAPTTTAVPTTTAEPTTVPVTQPQPTAPDISPDTVGIYIPAADGTAARKRVTRFSSKWTAKKDIDCFEILASQAETVSGSSFASIWNTAWNSHANVENAKIGYRIRLSLADGQTITRQLLKPSDSASFYDYLEIYMYDDVHIAPGVWYSHLEDPDMTDTTVITSIKLTAGSKIAQVGDISLTAFIYTGQDCFDEEGNYFGSVSETILIQNAGS